MLILHHVFARLACRHAGYRVTSFMNYMVVSHITVLLADEPAGGVAGKWHEQSALSTPVSGHQRQALRTKRLHSGNLRRSQQGAVKPSQGATTGRENRR